MGGPGEEGSIQQQQLQQQVNPNHNNLAQVAHC
jgi:hypothetical protein